MQHRSPGRNEAGDPTALILGMKLGKPGHDPGTNGVAVLTDILQRGHPAGYVAAYNNSRPEDWQLAIRSSKTMVPAQDTPPTRPP